MIKFVIYIGIFSCCNFITATSTSHTSNFTTKTGEESKYKTFKLDLEKVWPNYNQIQENEGNLSDLKNKTIASADEVRAHFS